MEDFTLSLTENDDRFGFVNDNGTPIYPSRDAFGGQILVRSSMQIVWAEGRFVCFPSHFPLGTIGVIPLLGVDGLIAVVICAKDKSHNTEDGDRDTEDAETDKGTFTPTGEFSGLYTPSKAESAAILSALSPKPHKPKGKH